MLNPMYFKNYLVSDTSCVCDLPLLLPWDVVHLHPASLLLPGLLGAAVGLLAVVLEDQVELVERSCHHLRRVVRNVKPSLESNLGLEILDLNNCSQTSCFFSSLQLRHGEVDDVLVDLSSDRASSTGLGSSSS